MNQTTIIQKNSSGTSLPSAGDLEYGEVAVNYAAGSEALSFKNTNNDIISFKSNYINSITMNGSTLPVTNNGVDLGTVLSSETKVTRSVSGDGNAVTDIRVSGESHRITVVKGANFITSGDAKSQIEAYGYLTGYTETDPIFTGSAAYTITSQDITNWNNKLDDHQSLSGYVYSVSYNSTDKKIYFYDKENHQIPTYVDATDFIKDGMVDDVEIATPTSGTNSGVSCLIVTFNTDAGKEDIEIPLANIFNPTNYYTKTEIDNKNYTTSAKTKTQIESYHYVTSSDTKSQIEGYGYTTNAGTITGINMNGASKGTSGVVDLGTVLTSFTETQLTTATTGTGNVVTGITVSNHQITTQRGQINGLPSVTSSDNGKILIVSGGTWTLTTPVNIYSGSGLPNNNMGNNGDIYLQTS